MRGRGRGRAGAPAACAPRPTHLQVCLARRKAQVVLKQDAAQAARLVQRLASCMEQAPAGVFYRSRAAGTETHVGLGLRLEGPRQQGARLGRQRSHLRKGAGSQAGGEGWGRAPDLEHAGQQALPRGSGEAARWQDTPTLKQRAWQDCEGKRPKALTWNRNPSTVALAHLQGGKAAAARKEVP